MSSLASAAEQKARGEQVSRTRSIAAAAVAGFATAVIVYRLLRTGA